jgi:hypothetical protein
MSKKFLYISLSIHVIGILVLLISTIPKRVIDTAVDYGT